MAKKEFKYRGLTLEELQALDLKSFAALIPSRARRTLLRGRSHQEESMLKKLRKGKTPKTHARDSVIVPEMVGKVIQVHRGKEFVRVEIEPEMIGHFLGEFALSRKRVGHSAPGVGATRSSANASVK
jgi:small subunit ribosomal protein S19